MASLGVLIAGVAHEINTPVGAILNVARNLSRTLTSMPERLLPFWDGLRVPSQAMAQCLGRVREINEKPGEVSSHQDAKRIEAYLEEQGVPEARQRSVILTRLGFTDPESVAPHLACFRDPDFLKLAETYGSVSQSVAIAETSSQKISDIVRALKYYARSDTDRMGAISVNESIQVALVLLRNHLKNRVSVVTDLAPDLPPVLGTGELNQIWTNLLSNACDAIESAGSEGRIEVQTRRQENHVVVTVTDTGVGIPPEELEKVFDPFYTTKDIGKGTGLGLSIVSGIVKKLGGSVEVASRPGETRFRVVLPAIEGAQSRAA
jgi:signal transduction histidine kinase